ncbi:hypothetical protein BH10PLA1_BH10PLA1_15390 [soil metagenome]
MRTRAGKYIYVAERLSRRIKAGDYHLQKLPAERDLAAEVGVSHATARKAIQKLLDEGLLIRLANGRLAVRRNDEGEDGPITTQIALLVPAWESREVTRWHVAISQLAARFKVAIRTVYYAHLDDPLVFSTLDRFDGTFFLPIPDDIPPHFMSKFLSAPRPVVVLSNNWTEHGVPSVRLHPPVAVQKLLDHLLAQGHKRIDCFNVQPVGSALQALMSQWNLWRAARGLDGVMINESVAPFQETLTVAYNVIAKRIREGKFDTTAMLCTTERDAAGAMRAIADAGMRVGHDVAVCTIDGSGRAEYAIPSLTSLEAPDPAPYIAVCLEWMLAGKDRQWKGPMLVEPEKIELAIRQSTVPDIDAQVAPQRVRVSQGEP